MITRGFFSRWISLQTRTGFFHQPLGVLLTGGLMLLSQSFAAQPALAASELMVSPTRVVFEGRTRSARVTLANTGNTTGRYRISFVRKQMTESGELAEVKEGAPGMYADEMVRFSPREVTLPPGQSQVVRLMLRKKGGLEDGEYRSHMLFQSLPDPAATSIQTLTNKSGEKLQIQLIPVVGVSIPIIVRHGSLSASGSLSNLKFHPTSDPKRPSQLSLTLGRTGDRSLYGDFKVTFKPDSGTPVVVAQSNGLALYTPNAHRTVTLNLQAPPGVQLNSGELHVQYLKHGEDGRSGLIAEDRLRLP
jgi:P pilus assembly chaperone PapD